MINNYKKYFTNRLFLIPLVLSMLFFCLAITINAYSGWYSTSRMGNYVSDLILDNTPIINVSNIFIYGPSLGIALFILVLLKEPWRIPFALENISIFLIIRSIFVCLTHFGSYPGAAEINQASGLLSSFILGGDFFFSGHTGLPFLMALVFSYNKKLFAFFFLNALFFGALALLGHLHYSIDVLSAFFITYTIYHISEWLFAKDKLLFSEGIAD